MPVVLRYFVFYLCFFYLKRPLMIYFYDMLCLDYGDGGYRSDWMEDLLAKKYEIKTQRIGKGKARNGVAKKQEGLRLAQTVLYPHSPSGAGELV